MVNLQAHKMICLARLKGCNIFALNVGDANLFMEFSTKSGPACFPFLDMTPDDVPCIRVGLVGSSLAKKHATVSD
jgi:hypothetical protein